MSDNNNSEGDNTLRLKAPRRIVLKKTVEGGSIKQNFAHGRSKSVVVEVRKKKTFLKPGAENKQAADAEAAEQDAHLNGEHQDHANPHDKEPRHHILKPLTEEEKVERQKKMAEEEAEAKRIAEEEAVEAERLAVEEAEAKRIADAEAAEAKRIADEEAAEAKRIADEEAAKAEEEAKRTAAEAPVEKAPAEEAPAAKAEAPVEKAAEAAKEETPAQEAAEATTEAKAPVEETPKATAKEPSEAKPEAAAEKSAEAAPAAEAEPEMVEEQPKRKISKAQREEMARRKTEDLVTKRLAQLEELREQKRADEQRREQEAATEQTSRPNKTAAPPPADNTNEGRGRRKNKKYKDSDDRFQNPRQKGRKRKGGDKSSQQPPPAPVFREVTVPETITVGELANRMAVKASEVIKLLFSQGMMVTINQPLDQETAVLVVEELGHKAKMVSEEAAIAAELTAKSDTEEQLSTRPPVVTVMGHVDHGKTSLLDSIRTTDVTSREHGGITQHIGAYQVALASGDRITFLDTPGHAAFTSMRARGADVTDIVVLVVAADDGVMPQTIEAINHAKSAGVPIVVAVNKIDKPDANPDRVMQQLSEHELIPEDWGGDTIFVPVSAKSGEGINTLEEMLLLQAEVLNLQANPTNEQARGTIIEANLDRGRGAVATCLVQNGTLKTGDICVVGTEWCRIRTMNDDHGKPVNEAPPSIPVELVGLSGVPNAGDELVVVPDERRAREIAEFRSQKLKEAEQAKNQSSSKLDDLFDQISQGEVEELNVVLKSDVQGSAEAVADALNKIKHEQIAVRVIHTAVGGINESDVMLAVASQAIVLGFNVRADAKARDLAKREAIDMRFYNVIYDLVDDIKLALEGRLAPKVEEKVMGHAQVREVFRISKVGNVAGCMITDGIAVRNSIVRVLRDNVVIYEGEMSALKRYKDDVKEVREGMECGISVEKFNDIKEGDVLEVFVQEEVKQTI
uniref:Translation initiation factor IF-2 n=1 Tax=Magnetococcus massalia (strain MO-1) TaxID=451514 RepID=A0A1S7LLG6_MAGMO|nr:Translation initiation factor IF-2 [Candidatus Magnetococcus massalia]